MAEWDELSGFLACAPVSERQLPEPWHRLQDLCCELPETMPALPTATAPMTKEEFRQRVVDAADDALKQACGTEDTIDVDVVTAVINSTLSTPQRMHLYHVSSMLVNSYAWCAGEEHAPDAFPRSLSLLICSIARVLGTQPIVTHASVVLYNCVPITTWQAVKKAEDMKTLHTFTGSEDEKWFYLVTAMIELEAVPALKAMQTLCSQHSTLPSQDVVRLLLDIGNAVKRMRQELMRMPQHCRPKTFYSLLRPFLAGWKHNDAVRNGIEYAGVHDQDRCVSGASAAQSTAIAAFDAFIGTHYDDDHYLVAMRAFMPAHHRSLLEHVRTNSVHVRETLEARGRGDAEIKQAFDAIMTGLHEFRSSHMQIVTRFIITPARELASTTSLAEKGTGGTNLMSFLKSVRAASDEAGEGRR